MRISQIAVRAVVGTAALIAACLAGTAVQAALVTISFTGITSTAEGAYTRYQDFLAGTTTYIRPPVYDDMVSGSFVIDTAKLPPPDPDQISYGFYSYATLPPAVSFGSSTFASSGYAPAPSTGQAASLLFPVSGVDYASFEVSNADNMVINSVSTDSQGNSVIRNGNTSTSFVNVLYWYEPLASVVVDGVSLPDFSQIKSGAFGSFSQESHYLADDVHTGSPDGPLVGRTVLRLDQTYSRSAGMITSISMKISAVPEPSAWVAIVSGFGLIGYVMRRHPAFGLTL